MIIVEGPDGAGKSTLVDSLAQEFDLLIGERGRADRAKIYESTREDTYTALGIAAKGDRRPLIWDRLFFSEFVYHDVVGRPCEFNDEDCIRVPRLISALESPVIFCMPPFGIVEENASKDEQMDGVNENIYKIYGAYKAMLNPADARSRLLNGIPRLIYDYTNRTPAAITRGTIHLVVKQYLDHCSRRSW